MASLRVRNERAGPPERQSPHIGRNTDSVAGDCRFGGPTRPNMHRDSQ